MEQKVQDLTSCRVFQVWHINGQKITDLCLASSCASATLRGKGSSLVSLSDSESQILPDCPFVHLLDKSGAVQDFPHQAKVTQGHVLCT